MSDCVHSCPCGNFGSQKACGCAPAVVTRYQKRISGPLLDRIGIHIEVPSVDYDKLSGDRMGESSESIRARVQAARNIQSKRFSNSEFRDIICNADMRVREIRQFCKLDDQNQSLMRSAMTQLNLSARGYHRVLKLARTIADLAGVGRSSPRIWQMRYSTGQSRCLDDLTAYWILVVPFRTKKLCRK